jgi:hypothetical protein
MNVQPQHAGDDMTDQHADMPGQQIIPVHPRVTVPAEGFTVPRS